MAIKRPPDELSLSIFDLVIPSEETPIQEAVTETLPVVIPEVLPDVVPEAPVTQIKDGVKGEAAKQFIIRTFEAFRYKHWLFDVFRDFCEIAALTITNSCDKTHWDEREKRYLEIVKRYDKDELDKFVQMFNALQTAFEFLGPQDLLGNIFQLLNLNSKDKGQFFTPQCVSDCMAKIVLCDYKLYIEEHGFITMMEPAVGGGSMVFAHCKEMQAQGLNYQQQCHVTAIDVDSRCAHMAYVQMSLLGVPGIVIHGNALSMETFSTWVTPFHVLWGWDWKLQRRRKQEEVEA